jgi:hypothetical protein
LASTDAAGNFLASAGFRALTASHLLGMGDSFHGGGGCPHAE